jgi:hypothetical protein
MKLVELEESAVPNLASILSVFVEGRTYMKTNSTIADGLSLLSLEWVMEVLLLAENRGLMKSEDGLGILTRMVRDEIIVTFYLWKRSVGR